MMDVTGNDINTNANTNTNNTDTHAAIADVDTAVVNSESDMIPQISRKRRRGSSDQDQSQGQGQGQNQDRGSAQVVVGGMSVGADDAELGAGLVRDEEGNGNEMGSAGVVENTGGLQSSSSDSKNPLIASSLTRQIQNTPSNDDENNNNLTERTISELQSSTKQPGIAIPSQDQDGNKDNDEAQGNEEHQEQTRSEDEEQESEPVTTANPDWPSPRSLHALRNGITNEHGDPVFFLPSFVDEDPWGRIAVS